MEEQQPMPAWFPVLFIFSSLAVLGGVSTGVVFTIRWIMTAPAPKLWRVTGALMWISYGVGAIVEQAV
jgi:hypothetical protein